MAFICCLLRVVTENVILCNLYEIFVRFANMLIISVLWINNS